jgi:hypothetical protein
VQSGRYLDPVVQPLLLQVRQPGAVLGCSGRCARVSD